jgi:hypothetical protein
LDLGFLLGRGLGFIRHPFHLLLILLLIDR